MARIGIVGGVAELAAELVSVLVERGFDLAEVRVLAEPEREGEVVEVAPARLRVEAASEEAIAALEIALFCGSGELAARLVEPAVDAGALVLDATPYSRRVRRAPLVVPEVNAATAARPDGVLASPMPATVALAIALAPLHRAARLLAVHATVFESASQRGAEGPEQLSRQAVALMQGRGHDHGEFPEQLAFNLRPQIAADASGWATEERALADELVELLGEPALPVVATSVRTSVFYGGAAAVDVELERPLGADAAREELRSAPGVLLAGALGEAAPSAKASWQDAAEGADAEEPEEPEERYELLADERPGPVEVVGSDAIHVARVRALPSDARRLVLWLAFDDVRRGIALNLVGMLEAALRRRRSG